MVLPLPVPPSPSDDAIRFINLEAYPQFFTDMMMGFPMREASVFCTAVAAASLVVHDVGDFEASFVPQLSDFQRLDSRFRLSDDVWEKLPGYRDYGFAVFKLKESNDRLEVHPMAFEFPTRMPGVLYFPTIHVHDGTFPSNATFDHQLYCQIDPGLEAELGDQWHRSREVASRFMDVKLAKNLIDGDLHCWCCSLIGKMKNRDVLLDLSETPDIG
jgi:hypothetical protein